MNAALSTLAEPRREAIVRLIWFKELAAGDIAARLPISFGAVSQHLHLLLDAGLVAVRVQGRQRLYRACPQALGALAQPLEDMWFGKLDRLKQLAEQEQASIDALSPKHPRLRRPKTHGTSTSSSSKKANAVKRSIPHSALRSRSKGTS